MVFKLLTDYIFLLGSCSVVFTADQGVRGGKVIPLKKTVDEALKDCDCVRRVFVAKRTGADVPFTEGRDVWLDDVSNLSGIIALLKCESIMSHN